LVGQERGGMTSSFHGQLVAHFGALMIRQIRHYVDNSYEQQQAFIAPTSLYKMYQLFENRFKLLPLPLHLLKKKSKRPSIVSIKNKEFAGGVKGQRPEAGKV
jgi:hypothetical protein